MTRDELIQRLTDAGFAVWASDESGPTSWGKPVGGTGGVDVVVSERLDGSPIGDFVTWVVGVYNDFRVGADPGFDWSSEYPNADDAYADAIELVTRYDAA